MDALKEASGTKVYNQTGVIKKVPPFLVHFRFPGFSFYLKYV